VENRSPLSGAGSCFSDLSGSSCGAGLAPWLANIFVNAPGSDRGVTCGVGGVGDGDTGPLDPWLANIFVNAPGSDWLATCGVGGVGDGDTGPDVIGAIPPPLENMRVNSPGADCSGGAPEPALSPSKCPALGICGGGGGVGAGEPGAPDPPAPCVA
jgi:hypothetical protein